MNHVKEVLLVFLIPATAKVFPQTPDRGKNPAVQVNATYKGDFVSNLHGGIETGSTYLGLVDLFFDFDTEKAGLWRGGELLVHGANSHGGEPSADLIGDFQVVSNIEAGDHTFLYELWYKQMISKMDITIGLQDMNAEFANSDIGALFLNSSFGIHSVIADNINAPLFPLTSPGITICYEATDRIIVKTALYKGCPVDFKSNPHNLEWDLDYQDGLLWITEVQFSWKGTRNRGNTLKAGAFFHQHCDDAAAAAPETGENQEQDDGFYLVGDHQIFYENGSKKKLNVFYQLGWSPRNDNFGYFGAGCTYTGLFSKNGTNQAGLAIARGMLTEERGQDETTFELTYKAQITGNIYFQPDVQYVVHPAGTGIPLKNAAAGLIRLGLEF